MAQSNPITITGWQKGQGQSSYVGFGRMVGMDIFRKPGIIQLGTRLINDGNTYGGFPTAIVKDTHGNTWVGMSNGQVYLNYYTIYGTVGSAIHDMVLVNDCLIISKADTSLDLLTNLGGSRTYVSGWKVTMNTSTYGWKKMFIGQDNIIYIGNETQLASLQGFTPTPTVNPTSATATLNTSCLSTGLPNGRIVQTICELNRYVAIMTSAPSNAYDNSILYFMDRGLKDTLGTSFFLSIGVPIPESRVRLMINQNNRLYFFGNDTGSMYQGNITTYNVVAMMPNRIQGEQYNSIGTITPNAIALLNNEIIFGIGGDFNTAYDIVYGVYALRGNSLICKNVLANGEYGQTTNVDIGAIIAIGNGEYTVGWQTGSTIGVDAIGTNLGTGFNCWFESPLLDTGSYFKPRTFQTIQFNTGNVLASGQALKLFYRVGSNQAWIEFATYSFAGTTLTVSYFGDSSTTNTDGLTNSFGGKFPVTSTTNLQLKVAFDTGTAPYGTNIELQSIILI